jgi:ATP adenylyltransferase
LGYVKGGNPADEAPRCAPQWLPGADQNCFLCLDAASAPDDVRNYVVWRGAMTMVVLNRYPYNNGHVLVAPLKHIAELHELDDATHLEAMRLLGRLTQIMEAKMRAEGFNIGLNLGRTAGAGTPGHLHWHLVPRWLGDVNFMPALAGTSVISQPLEALGDLLREGLAERVRAQDGDDRG